eukprot:COSAG06_NODE_842_length_11986_cov_54.409355_16_plen_69_part_00
MACNELATASLLLHAVGLWPSRDNVWTNSSRASVAAGSGLNPESDPPLQTGAAALVFLNFSYCELHNN